MNNTKSVKDQIINGFLYLIVIIFFIEVVSNIINIKGSEVGTEKITLPIFEKKIGDANVSYSNGELFVDNFPRYSMGIVGINQISWGSFSFDKLDEYVYKIAVSESNATIYIAIRHIDKDKYGNAEEGNRITIGLIDVEETKKFTDYDRWHRYNSTFKMWRKDYAEYERRTTEEGQGKLYYVTKSYEPKSIR